MLPVICEFSPSVTQKIVLNIRNFSMCTGTTGDGAQGLQDAGDYHEDMLAGELELKHGVHGDGAGDEEAAEQHDA